jgi:hypothetical protein
MAQSLRNGPVAASEVGVVAIIEEADAEGDVSELRLEGEEVGVDVQTSVDAGVVPKSMEVETGLGCADNREDGTGMVDVSSGIGELNEPFI